MKILLDSLLTTIRFKILILLWFMTLACFAKKTVESRRYILKKPGREVSLTAEFSGLSRTDMYDDDVDRFRIDSYEITAEDVKDKAYYKLTINYKEGSSQQSITSFERCEYKLKPTEGDDCEFYGSNYVVETSDLTAKDSPYERFVPLNEAPTLKGAIDLSSLLKEVDGLTRSPGPNRGKSPCQLKEESR